MNSEYKKLVLDPRCLRPEYEINNQQIYLDALEAVNNALDHPYITISEAEVLETLKYEIRINRFDS